MSFRLFLFLFHFVIIIFLFCFCFLLLLFLGGQGIIIIDILGTGLYTYNKSFMLISWFQEEKRIKRQNQVFQEFKNRTARAHSLTDGK